MSSPIYNTIGKAYNTTRCADPYITGRIYELLAPKRDSVYLDIGCGTANYLVALAQRGVYFYGVDPSETMLEQAKAKKVEATFVHAQAESLPVGNEFFDGAIALFTLHHWADKLSGLKEVNRTLKRGARMVFLTFTGEQMKGYWLNEYFPVMMRRSWKLVPELPGMEELLNESGFRLAATENYFVQDDLQDHFLYSNKRRPEQYLRPEIRQNASSFSAFCEPEELHSGLAALERDIATGKINDIMKEYENDRGDYLFIVAEKV